MYPLLTQISCDTSCTRVNEATAKHRNCRITGAPRCSEQKASHDCLERTSSQLACRVYVPLHRPRNIMLLTRSFIIGLIALMRSIGMMACCASDYFLSDYLIKQATDTMFALNDRLYSSSESFIATCLVCVSTESIHTPCRPQIIEGQVWTPLRERDRPPRTPYCVCRKCRGV